VECLHGTRHGFELGLEVFEYKKNLGIETARF
jgi:hypothetical protein